MYWVIFFFTFTAALAYQPSGLDRNRFRDPNYVHCDDDYTSIYVGYERRLRCYKLYTEKKTFEEAINTCRSDKGDLASLHNDDDSRALLKIAGTFDSFIGLHRYGNTWRWTDNTPFNYQQWRVGEPNNQKEFIADGIPFVVKEGEQCGALNNIGWNDVVCHFKYSFICQKQPYARP